jgi:hypothetical protein
MSTIISSTTYFHNLIFTAWLGMEMIGVALAVNNNYQIAGWCILGVFTGLAVVGALTTLVYNIYSTYKIDAVPKVGEVKPPADSVSVSATNFTATLEQSAAV